MCRCNGVRTGSPAAACSVPFTGEPRPVIPPQDRPVDVSRFCLQARTTSAILSLVASF
jgi:hypothetical protein